MSVSDKEISGFGVSVSGVVDDDDDCDDDDDDDVAGGGVHGKKQRAIVSLGKKAKSFVMSPLKKKLFSRKKQTHLKPKSIGKASSSSSSSGNNVNNNKKGCCFCFTRSSNGQSESPNGSQTSDPNDPNFTYDMLRVLIERNDFCCKQCNTHLDSDEAL